MPDMINWLLPPWPLWADITLFLTGAILVGGLGPRMAKIAQALGDRLGLTEALAGALLLGLSTSMPGVVAVASAGFRGNPDLAVATGFGGIIAQTSFLVIADLVYRRRNMEHDVHTTDVMMTGSLLIGLIGLAIMAMVSPQWTFWQIHPATFILPVVYLAGIKVIDQVKWKPGWQITRSRERAKEKMEEAADAKKAR